MRRYERDTIYRPHCRSAGLSWWVARFALVVCIITGLLLRYDVIETTNAFVVFACAIALAVVALLLAILAFRRIWREDDRGFGKALLGFFCALLVIGTPLALHFYVLARPDSAHISTDIAELPPFSRSKATFAARDGTIPATPSDLLLARQAGRSPDTVTLFVDTEARDLLQQVQEIARHNGWNIVSTVIPGSRFDDGHVDMVAKTMLLRLPVDITVRIRPTADGTRVDMRCASRYPYFDISDNPALVRILMQELAKGPPLG